MIRSYITYDLTLFLSFYFIIFLDHQNHSLCTQTDNNETMDANILRRLDCLSKKQLLAAIMAVTDNQSADSVVVTSLAKYLESIPASVGSSRPLTTISSTLSTNPEVKTEKVVSEQGNFDISK